MTFARIFSTTSVLALFAGPAFADLTAPEVWADWKSLMESYGAQVTTAGEDQSGGTLTVSRLEASFAVEGGSDSWLRVPFAKPDQQLTGAVRLMAELWPAVSGSRTGNDVARTLIA